MKEEKYTTLEILENGTIQLLIQTAYIKEDGSELTRENWRTCLMPGDFERASELLDEYYMNIVNSVWTDEVVLKYIEKVEGIKNEYL